MISFKVVIQPEWIGRASCQNYSNNWTKAIALSMLIVTNNPPSHCNHPVSDAETMPLGGPPVKAHKADLLRPAIFAKVLFPTFAPLFVSHDNVGRS
jgi:hypothetical protein